ncbi:unnamed protein product [Tilletia laevis]|uniref:Uncharacterized protein n=1 Tax=Tilletia laevis TaxID=157183 RepID=A0A9N8M3F5_9BASI|nr:unnamed protein product [Tilletia controversa]CAD6957187.1 unnamed protein product [Tilletia laevis]
MQGQRAGHTDMSPSMGSVSLSGTGGASSVQQQQQAPYRPPAGPTPQELAAQRENEAAAATVASLPAKYQPSLLASPYATASPSASSVQLHHDSQRRAPSPSPSMRSHASQHRAKSPSEVFMGAPPRSTSPAPPVSINNHSNSNGAGATNGMSTSMSIEDVVGTYGQSFPGERKALSRQNSTASRAPSHAGGASFAHSFSGQHPPPNGQFQAGGGAGMAGVGARGRSPSPGPPITGGGPGGFGRPNSRMGSHQYHHES